MDPLTTRPIQMGREFNIEPNPSWQLGFIDNPDHQFAKGLVWTHTRTRSDGPELLLPLIVTIFSKHQMTITLKYNNDVIVYTFKQIVFFCQNNHYILVVQCILWIVLLIGSQQGSITHIDNLYKCVAIVYKDIQEISTQPRDIPGET